MTGEDIKGKGGRSRTKSIDFKWNYGIGEFYSSHKHSWSGGGSQDNQYSDIQLFIEESLSSDKEDRYYVAIADGQFYQEPKGKAGMTRIENLKQMAGGNPRVLACTTDELEAEMKRAISDARG